MYVEQDRLVVCDDPGEEVYIFETVSGNATSLEVARTLLASGSKRAIVVDRDTGVLGTLSVLMLVRIMERVLL
jgi:CBS domain-containing protein